MENCTVQCRVLKTGYTYTQRVRERMNVFRWRFTFTLKYFSVKTDTIVLFVLHNQPNGIVSTVYRASKRNKPTYEFPYSIKSKQEFALKSTKHRNHYPRCYSDSSIYYMLDFDDNHSLTYSFSDSISIYLSISFYPILFWSLLYIKFNENVAFN